MNKISKVMRLLPVAIAVCGATPAFADTLYVSNNVSTLSPESAYLRLIASPQTHLRRQAVQAFRHAHVSIQSTQPVLGNYYLKDKQAVTADNTLAVMLNADSPSKLFSVAATLSKQLNQESVAVFIDAKQQPIQETALRFKSPLPTVSALKAPLQVFVKHGYPAYSLYIGARKKNLKNSTVQSIEWLGNPPSTTLLAHMPSGTVTHKHGTAYLIFKNHGHSIIH